ncbi:fasciclin domain-containing protein [Jejuia pallidilutea]|uniref:Fasciclin domain protein n=2 Tax=Jejuia pallidilutea TaxID=504487 RepID=A0A090VV78_9FLAO|nr:fasciclin domain-containing protein [Jejuia pallidilutea]PQV45058.1 putative surface protein with fasciclin (FAS1) repeats [Jejuia pallidilutea]GAL67888.1 fasciclin domain protein [Jejuia pallidilutea]GAL89356.1 fasciclin domain protein [Jejuia pallidilutea]
MKIKSILLTAMLLFAFQLSAQWSSNEVLNNIEAPQNYTTLELAQMDRNLSTFTNLVFLSGLAPSMLMTDDHTLLIPTNEAFKEMSVDDFLHLTNPKNRADLVRFVTYHFLPNKVMKLNFEDSQVIDTQGDEEITVSVDEPFGITYIGSGKIIKSDIEAKNGVIHVVNSVIKPTEDVIFN